MFAGCICDYVGFSTIQLILMDKIFISNSIGDAWAMSQARRRTSNIGIKHDFQYINICQAPREMLKPEPDRRGFQPLSRGPTDVNVSEKHV